MRWFERVMMPLAALFLFSLPVLAQQQYAAPFPRDGVKKVLEDEQFAVWDVTYEKGVSTGMHKLPLDQVAVNITVDGLSAIKVTKPDGTWSIENEKNGSVRFESKGTVEAEEGASDRPVHVFVYQLKEFKPPHWPLTPGVPAQFENRTGAVKLFETDRIIVWDDVRLPGMVKGTHNHYAEVGVTYYEPSENFAVGVARVAGKVGPPIEKGPFAGLQPGHAEIVGQAGPGTGRAIWVQYKYDF